MGPELATTALAMAGDRPSLGVRLFWTIYLASQLRREASFPFRPGSAIRKTQSKRVRRMIQHAYRTVPYYRETMARLNLTPLDFRTADDLGRLPIVERDQLQRDPEYFRSSAISPGSCLCLASGGSSGRPCAIGHDPAGLFKNAAHGERERSILSGIVGRGFGYREAVISSHDSSARRVQRYLARHLLAPRGVRVDRTYVSLRSSPEEMVRQLNEFQPDHIQSYGSGLELLFGHLQRSGTAMTSPKVVSYSSDALPDAVRKLISDRYGIPVFSTYQSVEALKIGFECEHHDGLHLNVDLYPLRIVDSDGVTVPEGTSGEVVVSNLVNRCTVLLNYRLGDVAALNPLPCPCGRTLPRLSFPQGRSDDILVLPSGRPILPQEINALFREEHDVWQYQIVQESRNAFTVVLVTSGGSDREKTRSRVREALGNILGPEAGIDVTFAASVARTAGGKVRCIVRHTDAL